MAKFTPSIICRIDPHHTRRSKLRRRRGRSIKKNSSRKMNIKEETQAGFSLFLSIQTKHAKILRFWFFSESFPLAGWWFAVATKWHTSLFTFFFKWKSKCEPSKIYIFTTTWPWCFHRCSCRHNVCAKKKHQEVRRHKHRLNHIHTEKERRIEKPQVKRVDICQ